MLQCLCLLGKNPRSSEGPPWVHCGMASRATGSWELEHWDSEVHHWEGWGPRCRKQTHQILPGVLPTVDTNSLLAVSVNL